MSISVRLATVGDVAGMSRVLIASITQLCEADHKNEPEALAAWTRNKTPDGVRQMLSNPDTTLIVAERNGAIIGVGAYNHSGGIELNYVSPHARGTGVTSALLTHVEKALAANGIGQARLEATATALAFYLSRGWQHDGPQASGRRVNGYPMVKTLR